ncbi:MAG: Eukaryotic translation initiation factor eIF2A [Gaiellaceae bacterium]|jgi:Tol biopolymer transport system component|nr:Eukaryotic translation initiation factor eIF2A [Gaiellaceae bacterium]
MKRAVAITTLGAALLLAGLGYGGTTSDFGRHRILLIGHGGGGARIFLWHPGSPLKPLTPALNYGVNGGGGFLSATSDGYWSPDGRSIAYEHDSPASLAPPTPSIYVMSYDGSHRRLLDSGDETSEGGGPPSWSPDSRELVWERAAFVSPDLLTEEQFAIVDVASGAGRTWPADLATSNPVWGKGGIAYFSETGLMLLDPATGQSRLVTSRFVHGALAWSPGGALTVGEPRQIIVLSASGQVVRKLPSPPTTRPLCGIAWSPRGRYILASVTARNGFGLARLWVETVSTKRWQRLPAVPKWANFAYDCAASWR